MHGNSVSIISDKFKNAKTFFFIDEQPVIKKNDVSTFL